MTEASNMSAGCESSETIVELNIKTLDSQVFSFEVDKNLLVSEFKEIISSQVGLPVAQQRLIFRGRVLKDDHALSEYHVENGHTLHLVARQPTESQTPPGASYGGQDPNATGVPPRMGQISQSVMLGTLDVGDQGGVPDISRVIGAVLNSIGLGGQLTGANGAANVVGGPQPIFQVRQDNQMDGAPGNIGIQSQVGTGAQPGQAFPGPPFAQVVQIPLGATVQVQTQVGTGAQPAQPFPGPAMPHVLQIPLGAAVQSPIGASIPMPSLDAPIPNSLRTLSEFISRMELALSQIGSQPNESQNNSGDQPALDVPVELHGLPTAEALITVLRQAQRLLGDATVASISHITERLEQEGSSTDTNVRGQIQREAMQVGLSMQHMGALFLELGRTMMMLRMGLSPANALVHAGPAVYISSTRPNPIMVQPFPMQASSLLGGSAAASNFGPIGIGAAPRHVNIHIHTAMGPRTAPNANGAQGPTRAAPNANGAQGPTRAAPNANGAQGPIRVYQRRNANAATVAPQPPATPPSGSQTGTVSQLLPGEISATVPNASGAQGPIRVYQRRNGNAATVPPQPPATVPSVSQTGMPVSQLLPGEISVSQLFPGEISSIVAQIDSRLAEVDSHILNLSDNAQTGIQPSSNGLAEVLAFQHSSTRSGSGNNDASNLLDDLVDPDANNWSSSLSEDILDGEHQKVSLGGSQGNSSEVSVVDSKVVPPSSSAGSSIDAHSGEAAKELVSLGQGSDKGEPDTNVPLGLGLGGLQPKRKSRLSKVQGKASDGTSNASDQNQQAATNGQQILQSLASMASQRNTSNFPLSVQGLGESQPREQGPQGQVDVANAMTEVLQSPALSGLLSGVSQQAGVGSPNVLRNMLEQFTRNPAMMNTVNQIAQQFDGQDVGNMLSGMGRGESGGGFDLAGMVQQMMPIVSQALGGGGPSPLQQRPSVLPNLQQQSNIRLSRRDHDSQVDLQPLIQQIENQDPPEDIFASLVATAARNVGAGDDLVNQLCNEEGGLANEFMDVLRRGIADRVQGENGPFNS